MPYELREKVLVSVIPEFQEANARYADTFDKADLTAPPRRRVAVITCMDARLDPARFLGLQEGDAHVIRNAGGRADADALRSLIISQQMLGTNEVVVIHHTDCGMSSFRNEDLQAKLSDQFGQSAEHIDFLPFADLTQSVRDDVQTIRNHPFIGDDVAVSGFIYDVKSGRIEPVD